MPTTTTTTTTTKTTTTSMSSRSFRAAKFGRSLIELLLLSLLLTDSALCAWRTNTTLMIPPRLPLPFGPSWWRELRLSKLWLQKTWSLLFTILVCVQLLVEVRLLSRTMILDYFFYVWIVISHYLFINRCQKKKFEIFDSIVW